jgi:hypothetical protein
MSGKRELTADGDSAPYGGIERIGIVPLQVT